MTSNDNKNLNVENDSNRYYVMNHLKTIQAINSSNEINLWRNKKKGILYYKSKRNKIVKENKDEIVKSIYNDYGIKVSFLNEDDTKCVEIDLSHESFNNYIVIDYLPIELFYPFSSSNSYIQAGKEVVFKNKFIYTDYLKLRESRNYKDIKENSFIRDLIAEMTTNEKDFKYIMCWLSKFFQTLRKSNEPIVLVGDFESSKTILFEEIIKPIFGEEFCCTINSQVLKEQTIDYILEDKIFYLIDSLPYFTAKTKKVKDFIFATTDDNTSVLSTNQDVYGETIFTIKENLNDELKDSFHNKYKMIHINSSTKIYNNLGCKGSKFYDNIRNDLRNFSLILATYDYKSYCS